MLRRADGEGEQPVATGTGTPPAGIVDPTVLPNGTWVVTVTVHDNDAGTSTVEIGLIVEGQLKLGRYHITYQDLAVPVGGLPIQVLRTYDTLNRTIDGDFGHGWSLDVADFRVDVHRPLGQGGWERYQCGGGFIVVTYCFRTTRPHYVTVTWPDGRVETFDFTPQGLSSFYGAGAIARYTPRPAATSELRPVAGDTNLGWTGTGDLWDDPFDPGDPYDPQRFLLVAKDGTRYTLDRDTGLVEARDRNGNTITIDDTGIRSSAGPDIVFTRNSDGRITEVTAPDGTTTSYTYTPDGDLDVVTDPNGRDTSYAYTEHALIRIVDPLGNAFQRLEYNDDGRLVAVVDANGNRTEITSDLDDRTQTVTSPDGRQTTLSTFDARGNQTSRVEVFDGTRHISTWAYSTDDRDRITSRTDPNGNTWTATYDPDGNLASFTDAIGHTTSFAYNDFGYPTAVTDGLGRTTTSRYDTRGNLSAITDPAGNTYAFGYDGWGNITKATDQIGRTTHLTYTRENRLASTTDPRGATWSYAYDTGGRLASEQVPATELAGAATTSYGYDAVGNLTSVTDSEGHTTTYAYDDGDRLTSVTDSEGHTTTYGYDAVGNLVSVTDPTGATTTSTFDARNQLVSRTGPPTAAAPGGSTTSYEYDGGGRLATITDPLARVTAYTRDLAGRTTAVNAPGRGTTTVGYDANGRVTAQTNGEGATIRYAFDPVGQLTAITDGLGRTTTYGYDDLGRRTTVTNPDGETTSYTFDAAGQLTSITDPTGATTSYGYDVVGNQTTEVDPIGRVTTTKYDTRGRIVSVTNPAAETTTYSYDQADRITRMIDGEAVSTSYTYDSRGLPTKVTDGAGNTHTTTYDPAGRLSLEADGRGNPTTYTYDPAGQLTRITDAIGGHVDFGYDQAGQRISVTDPNGDTRTATYTPGGDLSTATDALGRTTTYTYDLAGRRTTATDPRGLLTTYTYDNAGQLTGETRPEGLVTYIYDPAGRRTAVVDRTGTATTTYDSTGRVTQVASPAGTLDYTYDPAGQLTSIGRPDGSVTYTYDGAGRTDTITHPNLGITDLDWRADSKLDAIARPNGVNSTYTYDGAGRLLGIEHNGPAGPLADYRNTLDANGNRTSLTITESGRPSRTEHYTLDDLNRLTDVDYGDGTSESFAYDAAGNQTQRLRSGGTEPGTTTYTYDDAQQLTTVTGPDGASFYSYDQAGNLTTVTGPDGTDTYTWDSQNMLTVARIGGTSQTYAYDADARRVTVDGKAQLWDTASGGMPTLVQDGSSSYLHGPDGILATTEPGTESWLLADSLGSIRTTTDSAGAVAGTTAYDAYGTTRSTVGTNTPFGYTGEFTDPTGLIHLRARQYDPGLGQFPSADSVQPNGPATRGWQLYAYATGNPTRWADPSGHSVLAGRALSDSEVSLRFHAIMTAEFGAFPTFIGPGISSTVTATSVIKVTGLAALIYIPLRSAGECLSGIPVFSGASLLSATSPLAGFSCTATRPPRTDTEPRPPIPAPCPTPSVCGDPGDEPDDPPPPPPDDDDDPDCEKSKVECIPLLAQAANSARDRLYGDPREACSQLSEAQRGAVVDERWLTRPFFGWLVHEETAREVDDRLEYVGRGGGPDFRDRSNPQCLYELTSDNPSSMGEHQRRYPGVPVVTYRAIGPEWNFDCAGLV